MPLEESIKVSVDKLYELRKPKLEKNNLVKMMKLATSDVQFSFNNIMYSQIDGVAMGSPLGPTLANIFCRISRIQNCGRFVVTSHLHQIC